MAIADLIQSYGYLAVAVGTFLEGEAVLLIAGAASSRGHLWPPAVIAVATLASFTGDQLYFHLGRRYGTRLLGRFPSLQARTSRARSLLERHHIPVILSLRFLYGLRVAGPFAIGMSGVSWLRYVTLNLLGAMVWAVVITGVGYGLGHILTHLLVGIDADELWWFGALLLCAALWWLLSRHVLPARMHFGGPGAR